MGSNRNINVSNCAPDVAVPYNLHCGSFPVLCHYCLEVQNKQILTNALVFLHWLRKGCNILFFGVY